MADAIPLLNASFESPTIIVDPDSVDPFATVRESVDDWNETGPTYERFGRVGLLDTGVFLNVPTPIDATTTIPPIPNADGNQLAFMQVNTVAGSSAENPLVSLWQETSTPFAADKIYSFTLAIGKGQLFPASDDAAILMSIGFLTPGGDFQFIAQRRIFATQLDGSGLGYLTDFTVYADPTVSTPNGSAVGYEIAVKIEQRGGSGGGFNLDNARLESAPVPEPTSLALMGLGGLLALRRRRA